MDIIRDTTLRLTLIMVMGRVWSGSSQTRIQTNLFLMDLDFNPDTKGLKFSDPNPPNLIALEFLMGP